MNEELIEILSQYLAVRELFYNNWLTPALFISKKGNRLAIRTMEDNLKKILLQTDFHVPFNVTCHTLRHSMASHLNDKEVDILVIQSILGHSSTRSTEPYIPACASTQTGILLKIESARQWRNCQALNLSKN